ncbi:7909_t:CDS:1, partial [Paraglomus brasilianum]
VAVIPKRLALGRAVKTHFANPYLSSNCFSLIENRGFSPLHER